MTTIWKYHLPLDQDHHHVEMPKGAKVLHIGAQGKYPALWALVNPGASKETRHFTIYGTGFKLPEQPGKHLGTVLMDNFVWHIFEDGG